MLFFQFTAYNVMSVKKKGGNNMQTNSQSYFKFLISAILSVVIGVVAGILFPSFTINYTTAFIIQLCLSGLLITLIGIYLFTGHQKAISSSADFKSSLKFALLGGFGSLISSILGLSVITPPIGYIDATAFGIAIGFFALMIFGVMILFDYFFKTNNNC